MNPLSAKLRGMTSRIAGLLRPGSTNREISAELESHIALHTDDGVRSGLSREESRRQALIQLGGAEQTRQAWRERNTLPRLEHFFRDLRYSVIRLTKSPSVTAIAILSIGLGIGANATIFSMVSRFVLRPAPVGDPTTLLALHTTHDGDRCCNNSSLPTYLDVRNQAKSFSGVAAYYELLPASIGGNGQPERVWGQAVTPNFFSVLELPMVVGRGFVEGEDHAHSVVLGERLWRRRFSADEAIAGKVINLSGRSFTVVGVAPAAFHSVDQILDTQFWVPLGLVAELAPDVSQQNARDFHWLAVVGRLNPGVTRTQTTAELKTLAQRFARDYPATDKGGGFVFEQAGSLPPRDRNSVLIFLAALSVVVLLVLAIAGANVANLLFAQAASRQREMAVRLALGATRGRLRRQMLMESVLLGFGGGAVGILLSLFATRGLSAFDLPAPVPLDIHVALDGRVFVYSFALSFICGIFLGLAPAWAASRPLLSNALKGEDALARKGRRFTLRNVLVVTQIAMSLVLVCVTGLFLRSLQSAANIDIGFGRQNLLLVSVDPRVNAYTPERTVSFLSQLQQHVAALPGVQSAVVTDIVPLSGGGRSDGFHVEGAPDSGDGNPSVDLFMATPEYFDTMGIPRIAGRDFGGETPTGPKTAVVSQSFAERFFPGKDAIGQHVVDGGTSYEIIAVVGNVKARTLGEETRPALFRSLAQTVASDPSMMGYTLMVRAAGNPRLLSQAVRKQVAALDPSIAIFNEETMDEHIRSAFFLPRLAATLFGTFGCIGLVLATVGLYGVMSYAVSRRTREIGIRMAMGAQSGAVERLILRQGLVLSCIAVALGWPAAWTLAKLATSFLYGIQPHDAVTFAVVPPLLIVIALVACWIPARRAASVNPMQALRAE
ncbi:MAG TPA: ABC transporter permease [Terracidiphilus sp.]|jgi:predicted permease|nr:ABC transporter permease [Terracidiphilus sp.]